MTIPDSDFWFIEERALTQYREFVAQFKDIDPVRLSEYVKELQNSDETLTIVGKVAVITIKGVLRKEFSFFSFLYNNSANSYQAISKLLSLAEQNEEVEEVELRVDSPGGEARGLFELLYILRAFPKPMTAVVSGRADSAAYGIVSQTDRIIGANEMSEVGSIGVGSSFWVSDRFVDITSTDAPKKWPDVKTEEGIAVVRAQLDEMHDKFVGIIASGRSAAMVRKVTVSEVNVKFGQGGTMLADAALAAGMIDQILSNPDRVSNSDFYVVNQNVSSESEPLKKLKNLKKMPLTLDKFKTDHADIYKVVKEEAITAERDRVSALLKLGKETGKLEFAIKCIDEGKSSLLESVQAEFLTARINKNDVNLRNKDNPPGFKPEDSDGQDDSPEKIEQDKIDKFVKSQEYRCNAL